MRIDVVAPLGGLSENVAFEDQPPATTSEAFNMRGIDPTTGRVRLSKGPGLSKHNVNAISNISKVADINHVGYTQKTVDYALDPGEAWNAATSGSDCLACETDLEGNVYVLQNEAEIVKYSADGTQIYVYSVPVQSGGAVQVLDVDEGGNVFTGMSGTRGAPQSILGSPEPGNGMILGDMDKAQLWKLEHSFRNNDDETEPELSVAWTLTRNEKDAGPTLRGLIGFVRVKGGRLYTIQHDNRQWKSWLVVYDAIHAGVPYESLVYELPYPAHALDVDPKGRIAISVISFGKRGQNPAHIESVAALTGWTVKDIDSEIESGGIKHKVWFDFDPAKTDTIETTGGLIPEDGDEVLFIRDANGSGRVLRFDTQDGKRGAIYKKEGLGGKPEIIFDGSTALYMTGTSSSSDADFRDVGRGIFPTYVDPDTVGRSSQYAVVALMRPEAKTDGTTLTNQFPVWSHEADNTTLSDQSALLINRGIGATPTLDTLASANNNVTGAVSWYCRAQTLLAEGSNTGLQPAAYHNAFNNFANALLVSMISCNGVASGTDTDDDTRSLFRVWGKPIDRFQQDQAANLSIARQFLGGSGHSDFSTLGLYRGGISRFVVLDRKSQNYIGADSICTHPAAPDSAFGNMVGQVTIRNGGTGYTNTTGDLAFSGGGSPTVVAKGKWQTLDGRVTNVWLTDNGAGYTTRPTVTAAGLTAGANASLQAGMDYAMGSKSFPTILEKLEGHLAWERGVGYLLHVAGFYRVERVNGANTEGFYEWNSPHPYPYAPGLSNFLDDVGPPENELTVGIHRFHHFGEILILMDGSGKLLDVKSHDLNGIGLGCRFTDDGTALYTVGNTFAPDGSGFTVAADAAAARRFDVGEDGSLTLAWSQLASLRMSGQRCAIRVDKAGNLYVPCNAPLDTTAAFALAVLKASDGTTIHTFDVGAGTANQGTFAVALPRTLEKADPVSTNPDYEGDLTDEVAEHVFIAGAVIDYAGVTALPSLRKYRLVTSTPNGDSPRLRAELAVAGGAVYRFDGGGTPLVVGVDALNATGYIHSVATSLGKLYYSDGARYKQFDPKTDTVSDWLATRGSIPPRCSVLEFWRGRVVLTGDGTGAVFMSRVLHPDDWDTNPPVPTQTQACSFASSDVGEDVPDRVTAFMPYNDDLATIGCDHSLHSLRGDPMAGGALDTRSDVTGMAQGRPWCRDATGAGWFIGSRGGLFRQANPLALPERVSLMKIERRLQEIDFASYYFRLAYDPQREGVWIMALPFGTHAETVETYFYEIKTDAFWADFINVQHKQFTALHVIDGDGPTDRRVLTGHGDGYVRFIDDEATSHDGTPIQSSVLMGPYKSPKDGYEIIVKRLGMVLASDQPGGLSWRLYASDTPDSKGVAVRAGDFSAGNNLVASARARGSYFWVELSQAGVQSRFSLERAYLEVEQAGRQRVRS